MIIIDAPSLHIIKMTIDIDNDYKHIGKFLLESPNTEYIQEMLDKRLMYANPYYKYNTKKHYPYIDPYERLGTITDIDIEGWYIKLETSSRTMHNLIDHGNNFVAILKVVVRHTKDCTAIESVRFITFDLTTTDEYYTERRHIIHDTNNSIRQTVLP